MLLYILVAIIPLLVGALYDGKLERVATGDVISAKQNKRARWWWLLIAALPMFALIAFRGSQMGADTSTYLRYFREMTTIEWDRVLIVNDRGYQFEEGFVLFEKLITYVTQSDKVYQVIYTAVYMIAVVDFANQLERDHFLFLYFFSTLGIYTFMFTGVRQCLAMSICLFSYRFIKKRHFIPFLLLTLLAFTFHKSAILFLVAYFVYSRKINFGSIVIYGAIAAWAFLNVGAIQEWFNDTLEYDYGVEETGNGGVYFAVILVITVFSAITLLYNKKLTTESQGMLNVGFVALIFWFVRLATRVAERPSYYFMFFSMAMLAYGMDAIKDGKEKQVIKTAICVLCLALFIYRFSSNFASLVPYRSFF